MKDLVAEDPNYGVALDQLEYAQTADRTNWYRDTATLIGETMGRVYGDNADVEPTLNDLAESLQASLDDNREDIEEVLSS